MGRQFAQRNLSRADARPSWGTAALIGIPIAIFAVASQAAPVGEGIGLDLPVATAIRARGNAAIRTTDIGHVWSWESGEGAVRAVTDDDGVVRMIDVAPSTGRSVRFAPLPHADLYFNVLPIDDADRVVGRSAIFTSATRLPDNQQPAIARGYQLGSRELVLLFDAQHRILREAFFGDRDELARGGLVPGAHVAHAYVAPTLKRPGGADYAADAQGVAYVRISVGKDGKVTHASIYVSSGNPQLDRIAIANAMGAVFTPAELDGHPAPAVYFHREDFIDTTKS
ncbi:MAG: TonB family protein [Candidatus Eremiobacteraeota bacterium]|nr:TonB family protein [Candidatus Eremiobacteraeota bacterium]